MATSTIKNSNIPIRKLKNYSNITIPAGGYVRLDSFSGLGVDTSLYALSPVIRGWSGTNVFSVIKGSNGTDFYLVGNAGTVTNLGIEYFFVSGVLWID